MRLTKTEMQTFVDIARMGLAAGGTNPIHWLQTYLHHGISLIKEEDLKKTQRRAIRIFGKFFRGAVGCREEIELFQTLSHLEVVNYYAEKMIGPDDGGCNE